LRIFWSLIALLVIATAGLLVSRRMGSAPAATPQDVALAPASATGSGTRTQAPVQPPRPEPAVRPEPAARSDDPAPKAEPESLPAPTSQPAPGVPAPVVAPPAGDAPTTETTEQERLATKPDPATVTEKPAPAAPADEPVVIVVPEKAGEGVAAAPEAAKTEAKPSVEADAATATAGTAAPATPAATVTGPGGPKARATASPEAMAAAEAAKGPPTLSKQADGTTLVDNRFVIKGDGTQESPYEVTWEQLMSAQETYKPRLGLKVIPGRLNLLHDKWVKVSGYVAFPVMAQGPDEMLMMLNQWDGCCIGVPPTPYDAIEVKLKAPAEGETRLLVMGSVTGKLQVDPYLVKDWLVSLYLMDEAVVTKQSGAPLREAAIEQEHLAP